MRCRVCFEDCLVPLWLDHNLPADRGRWHRCLYCGSDSSETDYTSLVYNEVYARHTLYDLGGMQAAIEKCSHNCNLIDMNHNAWGAEKTFLDVGCAEGAALAGMQARGWSVHGFDVIPAVKEMNPPGDHITIASEFRASLFPRQYGAVMAREVLEHVPDWKTFLHECRSALLTGGLLHVQTPRPWAEPHPEPYHDRHLQIFAPFVLEDFLTHKLHLSMVAEMIWDRGQCWLMRK